MDFLKFVIEENKGFFNKKYSIKDDTGREVVKVESKSVSAVQKMLFHFIDFPGLNYRIQRESFFSSKFQIFNGDVEEAVIAKEFSFSGSNFIVNSRSYGKISVKGDMMKSNYTFSVGENEIARISRARVLAFNDSYGVALDSEWDYGIILAIVVIIDLVKDLESG